MQPTSAVLAALASSSEPNKAFDFARNPYKAKRNWPPDFDKLSDRYQFRLERKYKRRSKLKWARPRFMIATKLAQWIGGVSILVYGVLYMDWQNDQAFKTIRQWYWNTARGRPVPTQSTPILQSTQERA